MPGTASVKCLERQVLKAESGKSDKQETGDKRNGDLRDRNVVICFFVRHLADAEQGDLGALMRQGVQCAGCNCSNTMHIREFGADRYIGVRQGVKGDSHASGCRAAGAGADRHGDHDEQQRGHIKPLQKRNKVLKADRFLYDAAKTDYDRSVENRHIRVCSTLIEYFDPGPEAALHAFEHQYCCEGYAGKDGCFYRNAECVKEDQNKGNRDQCNEPVGKIVFFPQTQFILRKLVLETGVIESEAVFG